MVQVSISQPALLACRRLSSLVKVRQSEESILWLLALLMPPISLLNESRFACHMLNYFTSWLHLLFLACYLFQRLCLLIGRINNVQHHAIWNWNHLFIGRNFSFSIPTFYFFFAFLSFFSSESEIKERNASCFFFFFVPHDVDVYVLLDNITRSSSRSHEYGDCWSRDANLKWRW